MLSFSVFFLDPGPLFFSCFGVRTIFGSPVFYNSTYVTWQSQSAQKLNLGFFLQGTLTKNTHDIVAEMRQKLEMGFCLSALGQFSCVVCVNMCLSAQGGRACFGKKHLFSLEMCCVSWTFHIHICAFVFIRGSGLVVMFKEVGVLVKFNNKDQQFSFVSCR